ncbi:hypothetical protein Tco_1182693 [Tanacetum coccineum]
MRLKTDIKPKEATFQVVLDAFALTSFYQAFLITTEVPAIYMLEFWATVTVHKSSIRFTINKKKFSLDVEILGTLETFTTLLTHEKTQVYGVILPHHLTNQAMLESIAYQTYYAYASGEKAPKKKLKSSAKVAKADKKKQPATMPKTKGLAVLYEVSGTNKGAGVRPEVPDVSKYDSGSDEESWTFSQDKEDADEETGVNDDSEETESDNDGDNLTHPNLSTYKADDQEEEEENKEDDDKDKEGEQEQDEEDDLYRDVNINLERSDAEMTDAQANKDTEDAHVTLIFEPPVVQQQSSSVSSDLMSKFINPSLDTDERNSRCGCSTKTKLREEAQARNHEFLNQVDSTMKAIIKEQITNQPQTSYAVAASLSDFELKKIIIEKMETNKSIDRSDVQKDLYKALVKSYNSDKYIISSYGDVVTLKKGRDDQDKDEDPSARSNRGLKRSRSGKEAKSQPKSSGKSAQAEEHGQKVDDLEEHSHQEFNTGNDDVIPTVDKRPPQPWISQLAQATGTQSLFNEFLATPVDFSAFIMNRLKIDNLTQEVLTGPTYDLIKGTCKSVVELEYHLEEVFKDTNDRLDWHNPEGKPYPHDLSKPLPLIQNERGESSSQKYTTSVTKTKAAEYGQVKWIEDKGPKHHIFYEYASNMESSKDVYSRHRIIAVTSLKIMKFFCYSHLEEIIVRRQDDKLYKFRESDFKRLRRQDIKDMLLILVQDKLSNLNLEEQYALNVVLRMFTRHEMNKNRLMRTDELHKFSDGTLNYVLTALNDIAIAIEMDYLPQRKWSKQDKQRVRVMINAIDKKLRDRRLMRNLEKFVGGRPYRKGPYDLSYDVLISQSDTQVITVKMEILLESTSNKLMVERFDTSAGNPVKEILLELNLLDHRSILTDSKMEVKVPDSSRLKDS